MNILDEYKNWLTVNGASHRTIINYISRIKTLLINVKLEELTETTIINFLLKIKEKYSASTFNGYRDTIKSFLQYLKKDIEVPKHTKVNRTLPESITEDYLEKEIMPVVDYIFENPLKVKTVLYVMFYTGIRVGEIEQIYRKNINLKERSIKFLQPKTKEERIGFFTEYVKQLIVKYFSSENETINAFNITAVNVTYIFTRINEHLKDVNFHPHVLRHSFAVHLLNKNVDISVVSKLLGHRSIQSTIRYLKLKNEQLKSIYDKHIR